MSKKLAAKNALIGLPLQVKAPSPSMEPSEPTVPRTRTAVGGMAQFVTTQSPIHREVEALRGVVKAFDGARIVRALDPSLVMPSQWANRHADTFENQDFAALKREIKESRGNVQPIKVRPLNDPTRDGAQPQRYEIVYGHRRHRACMELDLPVNAMIEDVNDQTLFEQMERENRSRKNLSAWEQGCMYHAALSKGLYPSQRKLSESIGIDVSLISKSIALAKLPKEVIESFPSPLQIQFRWAQPLNEALQKDPDGLLSEAKQIKAQALHEPITASEIFRRLTRLSNKPAEPSAPVLLDLDGKQAGQLLLEPDGGAVVKFYSGVLTKSTQATFKAMILDFLKTL